MGYFDLPSPPPPSSPFLSDTLSTPPLFFFSFFLTVVCWIAEAKRRSEQTKVLLHCQAGVSRSATFMMAYLMWKNSGGFREALDFVSKKRCVVSPNGGFIGQLFLWETVLRNSRDAPSSAPPRFLQVCGHSGSRRELVFVGKEISKQTRATLDSRGSFVIHCPAQRNAFMWIGLECSEKFIVGAQKLCQQLKDFLSVAAVSLETHGSETDGVWS